MRYIGLFIFLFSNLSTQALVSSEECKTASHSFGAFSAELRESPCATHGSHLPQCSLEIETKAKETTKRETRGVKSKNE